MLIAVRIFFVIVDYVCFFYSIIQLIRKRKKSIIRSCNFLILGYVLLMLITIAYYYTYLDSDYFNERDSTIFLYILIYVSIIIILCLWPYSHWEFRIDNEYVIYKRAFFGTEKMKISDIDKKKSRWLCIIKKFDSGPTEILMLYDRNGKKMKVRFGTFYTGYTEILTILFFDWKIKRERVKKVVY